MTTRRQDCEALDRGDPLGGMRTRFHLPADLIYLDGNSLGPLPLAVLQRLEDVSRRQWGEDLIKSWNTHDWIGLPQSVGEKIAPLVGAAPGQVICTDSTSINLFKLVVTALKLNSGRRVVLSQADNFPTDLYIVQGLTDLLGAERCELRVVEESAVAQALDDSVALLLLTEVNFRTGARHDMASLTAAAHRAGALVLWDLSHSAGAVPVHLDACEVDFAVGCGYKFLNGGPGAPAYLYVASRHQEQAMQPLWGWMGHRQPFGFQGDYQAADGIGRFASGTPGILGLAALDAALDLWADVDVLQVRQKSVALGDLFHTLVGEYPALGVLRPAGPADADDRGSQIGFRHPEAYGIVQALIARGIVGDFREPDIVRFGLCPMFLRYVDVFDAVAALNEVVDRQAYLDASYRQRSRVT